MENCIFCKIIKKEIPATIVYEDKKVISFLDINPVNHGHLLLIPKKHHKIMTDTPNNLVSYLFLKSKWLMSILKEATNADYIVLSVVGLDIPHFHVHIIPRYLNDGLANFWPTKKYKNDEEKEIAKRIKAILK